MFRKTLCAALTLTVLTGIAGAVKLPSPVLEIPVSDQTLSYRTDEQGSVFGPQDYFVSSDIVYLLDSAQNRILSYRNQELIDVIPISDFSAIDIAGDAKNLYAIDSLLNLYRYDGSSFTLVSSFAPKFDEMISNFQISNGFGYFYVPEGDHGTTYQFKLPAQYTAELTVTQTFDGHRLDDDTFYYKDSRDSEELFSSSSELVVYHPSSGQTKRIPVSSDDSLGQVQYLGTTAGGSPMVYLEEISQDEDYRIRVTQSIRILSDTGRARLTFQLPKQPLYTDNALTTFHGSSYMLLNQPEAVRVLRLDF